MKEATGELNMTVITVVAIAAIAGLFYAFVWPMIQRSIVDKTCQTYGPEYHASNKGTGNGCIDYEGAGEWKCCKVDK
ncbi:MAG: hypothetical protein RSD96_02090 [Bacilli bacterium]